MRSAILLLLALDRDGYPTDAAKEGLSQEVAATTILLACDANTLVKAFLALWTRA